MDIFAITGAPGFTRGIHALQIATCDNLLALLGFFVLSIILSMHGRRAWKWPGILLTLNLLFPVIAATSDKFDYDYRFHVSRALMIVGGAAVSCQLALKFQSVREALGIKDSGLPPPWEYGLKWAGPEPPPAAIQDHPPDKRPDGVSPPP